MIYFDIDGVTRDLCSVVFLDDKFTEWGHRNARGQDLVEIVNDNPALCKVAPPTEYLPVINTFRQPHFLSVQPDSWRRYTREWLDYHVRRYFVQFFSTCAEKIAFLQPGDLLVEDYPHFDDYSQIILIDRPYNQDVACLRRVRTPRQLWLVLDNEYDRTSVE
jgi:hypothetical protein